MKKLLLTIIITTILITSMSGCIKNKEEKIDDEIKKITCTKEDEDELVNEKETSIIYYKDNKVIKLERENYLIAKSEEITEEDINDIIEELKYTGEVYNETKGFKFDIKKIKEKEIKMTLVIDYSNIDLNELKENIGEEYVEKNFSNGLDQKPEDLQKALFENFECK